MDKISKEKLLKIGEGILQESDIVAKHGTTIANAKSIMEQGLYMARETFVMHEGKSTYGLMTYGFKTTLPGDSANVIISVPKEFLIPYLNLDGESYEKMMEGIKINNQEKLILSSVIFPDSTRTDSFEEVNKTVIPKEFIKGVFIYTDNKTYKDFSDDWDLGLDYLGYVENKNFFTKLSEEEKNIFVQKMQRKLEDEEIFGIRR